MDAATVRFIDGARLRGALSPSGAVDALHTALLSGLDPEKDSPRTRVELPSGQFLQMPSAFDGAVGTKLLTITPENASRNAPVIQGLYVLFGGPNNEPRAVLDGIELTNLRTSAVSAFGARLLVESDGMRIVVFGTGVQAWEHIRTFDDVFTISEVAVVGRNPEAAASLAARAQRELGLAARAADAGAAAQADVIICCTAAREPLFDSGLVSSNTVVIAVGSHEPSAREVDEALMGRSAVVVESCDSALREAGDIIQAVQLGAMADPPDLITLTDLVTGRRSRREGVPAVFKTTGMPWEDLAVARAVAAADLGQPVRITK